MGAHILGEYFNKQNLQPPHDLNYFMGRDIWFDARVPGMITIHPTANIGWDCKLVVQSHDITNRMENFGRTIARPITIGAKAFIGAFSILYNCTIGEGAVVAVGSVVRSQTLAPWTMWAGNPAVKIKEYVSALDKWHEHPLFRKE